jgi:DNA-binding transcriptional regulator GbsR (MarR family)
MENFARYTGGLCSASQSTIAKETGVKRQTVNKAIKELKEIGLITDTTIDKGQHPHWYDVPEFDEERWRFTSRDQPDDFEMKKQ